MSSPFSLHCVRFMMNSQVRLCRYQRGDIIKVLEGNRVGVEYTCEESDDDAADAASDKLDVTVAIICVANPSSDFSSASSPLKSGINLVHQRAILNPRSMKRCFRMNMTTRRKNINADIL